MLIFTSQSTKYSILISKMCYILITHDISIHCLVETRFSERNSSTYPSHNHANHTIPFSGNLVLSAILSIYCLNQTVPATRMNLKPIFHQNAKYLASGVGVGQFTRRQIFALPNAKYTNMLVYFGVTPDANPQRQSVEYRWRWAFWHWGWRWACTFHVVYVNFICVGHPMQTRFFGGIWALVFNTIISVTKDV